MSTVDAARRPDDIARCVGGIGLNSRRWIGCWVSALAALATIAIAFNAVVFTATNAMSVLMSDSWYFVESFLMGYYQRGLTLTSLLAKRSAVDHAGPMQKLILLVDTKLFGMDFRMEGLFSLFVALVSIALLGLVMKAQTQTRANKVWLSLAVCAITAVYLSMNATVVFEWPLVTLYFVTVLVVLAFFAAVANALSTGRYWLAALIGFVCFTGADDIGVLAFLSAVAIVSLAWLRKHSSGPRILGTLGAIAVAMLASRTVYAIYGGSFPDVPALSALDRLSSVLGLGVRGLAEAVVIITSAPFVQREQLPAAHGLAVQIAVAIGVLALHVFFWMSQWRARRASFSARLAGQLMVFTYLLAAGILYGRVSELGLDYLNSPRYVQFFGLGVIAIILQLYTVIAENETLRSAATSKGVLLGLAMVLVASQLHYIRLAWVRAPYSAEYERHLAQQIGQAADPANVQALQCLPQIVVCKQPYAKRKDVLEFLQAHQLNVFSPRMQRLRRLYPSSAAPN